MTFDESRILPVAKAICQEECAYRGEPACWHVLDGEPNEWIWPNPNCNEPGCIALAWAAIGALVVPSQDRGSA